MKCQHHLEQHQQTNARCLSYQGKGPGRITCRGCGKEITAQAWAVEQHAWSCRQSRNDPYWVVGNQEVDGVIGRGHHGPSGSAPVRLRFAIIYGIILSIRSWPEVPPLRLLLGLVRSRHSLSGIPKCLPRVPLCTLEPLFIGHSLQFNLLTDAFEHHCGPGSQREYRLGLFTTCFLFGLWSPSSTKNLGCSVLCAIFCASPSLASASVLQHLGSTS